MPPLINFDRYFSNFPKIKKETDFDYFWKNALTDLKAIAMEPVKEPNKKLSSAKFEAFNIHYRSFSRSTINARLYIPKKKEYAKPIIIVHDYMIVDPYKGYKMSTDFAYLFIELRGHHILKSSEFIQAKKVDEIASPGFMIENILSPENYYLKGVYLDIFRSIDLLRLYREIDCSSIGIIGKGLGAAAAVFCSVFSPRIKALVLDSLTFADLPTNQNLAEGYIVDEINGYMSSARGKKNVIKRNLSYFDAVNFAEKVETPVLMVTGTKSTSSPTECVFSFFNYLQCDDKTLEVYPGDGDQAGGEKQFKKSLSWLKKKI